MSRRFTAVTVGLVGTVGFLVGLVVAGSLAPAPATSSPVPAQMRTTSPRPPAAVATVATVATTTASFADIVERLNPAVVSIDASSRGQAGPRRFRRDDQPRAPQGPPFGVPRDGPADRPQRGTGAGFIIEADGHILTNYHVVEDAERIIVKLSDGRSLRALVVGVDPPTDLALLKVATRDPLPVAPLGDSDRLRVGEWVCAIGNPLAYEHTVTVGVVSFLGRKLFDASLDNFIQTDAAINLGSSGGPLINTGGEVVGINSALSWQASNIGFAIPSNQARDILPQLKARGRVARGYLGITLRDLDADLQQSLNLTADRGALVMDVAIGSPGDRAGLQPYDLVQSVDGELIDGNTDLIRRIAAIAPGSVAHMRLLRDGHPFEVTVKLAERPAAGPGVPTDEETEPAAPVRGPSERLGVVVQEVDEEATKRFHLPSGLKGLVVVDVAPVGPARDAGMARGDVVLEINRRPMRTVADLERFLATAGPEDALALYLFSPDTGQRLLRTLRVEGP